MFPETTIASHGSLSRSPIGIESYFSKNVTIVGSAGVNRMARNAALRPPRTLLRMKLEMEGQVAICSGVTFRRFRASLALSRLTASFGTGRRILPLFLS